MFLAFRLDFRLGAVYHRRQKQLVNTKKNGKIPGCNNKMISFIEQLQI